MQAKREWGEIFKVLQGKKKQKCQPRILYLVKLSSKSEKEIMTLTKK